MNSKTAKWNVYRKMLLPEDRQQQFYGFDTVMCPNVPNCVFLLKTSITNDDLEIEYYYLDHDILALMTLGLLQTTRDSNSIAKGIVNELKKGPYIGGSTWLPKGLFVKLKDAESLLTIAGCFSRIQDYVHNSAREICRIYYYPNSEHHTSTQDSRLSAMKGSLSALRWQLTNVLDPAFKWKLRSPEEAFPFWFT